VLLTGGCKASLHTGVKHPRHKAGWLQPIPPDPEMESHARYADGVLSEMKGDIEGAMDAFQRAVALAPADEDLMLDVTQRFLQYRHPERALGMLTNAVARPGASGQLYARLGLVYGQLGRPDLAAAANQTAIRKAPTLLSAHQGLCLNYLQLKQEDEALKVLDRAAEVPQADAEFLLGIAEMYSNVGLLATPQRTNVPGRIRALLERAASLQPTNVQTRLKLADGFNQFGDPSRAADLYRSSIEHLEQNTALRNAVRSKLADIYLRTHQRAQAAEQLEALTRDDPMNAQAHFVLGSLALEEQHPDRAADCFQRAILANPRLEPAYYELASAHLASGRIAEALAVLDKARARFQQTFWGEYLAGVAHARQQDYRQALQHYTAAEVIARAGDTNRLTAGFYFQLGVACERSGDIETAVRHFEKCLELSPGFHEAQNYLGYMWAERGTNLHRALDLIERAVKAQPTNSAYLDSLGWVLFKLGRPREALVQMQRALEHQDEPDATLYEHLGDIHAALGHFEQAREAWQKALAIQSSDTLRNKLAAPSPP